MNFNQKENTLFLVYQHSLKQRHIQHNGNPDREEVISLEDKDVSVPCIYIYNKLFVSKQLCQKYLRSDSVIGKSFREKHLNIKMDKMIKINRLEYLELESLINALHILILKRGTDEKINFNRRRFIYAYENQIKPLIESHLIDILFRTTSYKESEKYLIKNDYSYKGYLIKSFLKDDNRTIGIFIDSKGQIQFDVDDVLSLIKGNSKINLNSIKQILECTSQLYYFSDDLNNSTKRDFIDEKKLIRLFLDFKLSNLPELSFWFRYIDTFLLESDKEVIYQLALPKRMLDELELSAKSNDFSLKEIFNTIISIFLKNPRKFIKLS